MGTASPVVLYHQSYEDVLCPLVMAATETCLLLPTQHQNRKEQLFLRRPCKYRAFIYPVHVYILWQ